MLAAAEREEPMAPVGAFLLPGADFAPGWAEVERECRAAMPEMHARRPWRDGCEAKLGAALREGQEESRRQARRCGTTPDRARCRKAGSGCGGCSAPPRGRCAAGQADPVGARRPEWVSPSARRRSPSNWV